ncbi:MAG: hypothetical protein EA374_07970 [Acholeplasmatales bacterium]|nr:MAG: hypothetical protein EA374_07970 [Acholeplasmatales bacterium]
MENSQLWLMLLVGVGVVALISYGLSRLKPLLAFLVPLLLGVTGLTAVILTRLLLLGWSALAMLLLGLYAIGVGTLSALPAAFFYFRAQKRVRHH